MNAGDKVQIDDPASDKHGLTGVITTVLSNGAVVQLDQPLTLERPFTIVREDHLKNI